MHKRDSQNNWRPVPKFENEYEVSNSGSIRSLDRYVRSKSKLSLRLVKGRVMRVSFKPYGSVTLAYNGSKTSVLVHRIVAELFVDNPHKKPCVNHLDGDKTNNNYWNLEWVTYSENELHSYKSLGKKPNPTGLGKIGLKMHNAKPVAQIVDGRILSDFECATSAARVFNTTQGRISCNARGESATCHGRKFIYISREEYYKHKPL